MTDTRTLLGLDVGNTVIKAVLFDQSGRQIALSAMDGRSASPQPDHVERDLDDLWEKTCQVIRDVIAKSGTDPMRIAAIGCAGHGNGLYLLDRSDAPLLGIQSLDARAAALARHLHDSNGEPLHRLCLQKPWPAQTPTLLAWIKRNRADIYARAGTLLLCKDFVTFKLTGEKVSEMSDMSGCGLLRMPTCSYDDTLLTLYGLEDAAALLPQLIAPTAIAGGVDRKAADATGLAPGTPVIGGLFDVVASALGSGVVKPGQASIIAGTWSVNQVLSEAPVIDPGIFMISGFGEDRFINIESSATSAANLEWYVREFVECGKGRDKPFDYCNQRVAAVVPAADDPIYHPYLYGSGQDADMRAGFYGLAGRHGEGHILRALFEGVVFEHRRHIEKLTSAGVDFGDAVLSGGGARSPVWPQIFADCLGRTMTVSPCEETGALGAAIAAGRGAGLFEDLDTGVARMTTPGKTFTPNPERKAHYDQRYRQFLDLTEALSVFWKSRQAAMIRRPASGV